MTSEYCDDGDIMDDIEVESEDDRLTCIDDDASFDDDDVVIDQNTSIHVEQHLKKKHVANLKQLWRG